MTTDLTALDLRPRRLGVVMEPDLHNPDETMGVLNPGTVRGRDGQLYLFPRVVGPENFSRVGRARVLFDDSGNPAGVERLGYVLEPTPRYERHGATGGCEDPRVTYFAALDVFVMVYAAWGPSGPRVALAWSDDLERWHRTGRVDFRPDPHPVYRTDFDKYHNKDGMIFPEPILNPEGRPSVALLHRPVYQTAPGTTHDIPPGIDDPMPSIWLSYCPLDELDGRFRSRVPFYHHHCLADPEHPWEALRIGGGAPPLRTEHGWLFVYHGVSDILDPMLSDRRPQEMRAAAETGPRPVEDKHLSYRAGVMLLDLKDPRKVLYRSEQPIMEPEGSEETAGVVSNVIFPTGLDMRSDLGEPRRIDMYYGAADTRIAAASFTLPPA